MNNLYNLTDKARKITPQTAQIKCFEYSYNTDVFLYKNPP